MDEYLEIRLDVFEHVGQRARVMKSLKVGELIGEILKEFDDVPSESPERFALYLKGNKRPLAKEHTLIQADIQPQDELIFEYLRQGQDIREMLDPSQYAFLRDEETGRLYGIEWTPAIVGRPTNEAEHNIMLAVNLQVHPQGMTVSRKHAQLTFEDGHYYLEALTDSNPTIVNKRVIPLGKKKELQDADLLFFGKRVRMVFTKKSFVLNPVAPITSSRTVSQENTYEQPASSRDIALTLTDEEVLTLQLFIEKSTSTTGEIIELKHFPVNLGRSDPILNTEKEISRQHLQVIYETSLGQFQVVDLKSRNGTFLDGIRLESETPYAIKAGMRLQLGPNVVLVVR